LSTENNESRAGKPTKIELLAPEIQNEIDIKLFREGFSAAKLVMWLKEERNILDIGVKSVQNYCDKMNGPLKALRGNFYVTMTAGVQGRIDALLELHKSAGLQMKRMSPLLEDEVKDRKMLPGIDRAMDLFRRTCVDILTVEMDLGVRKRVSTADTASKGGMSDNDLKDFLKSLLPPKKTGDLKETVASG
jgi:hypothetical protein